jgi:hypothetical protein
MRFEWRTVREHDADGRLREAGAEWREERAAVASALLVLIIVNFIMLMLALIIMLLSGEGQVVVLALLAIIAISVRTMRTMRGRRRALIFHRDGRTSAPHGFAHYHRRVREITGTHAEFVSIEARGPEFSSSVLIFTGSGGVIYAGRHLHHDDAHRIAVQLTIALRELRESIGRETRPQETDRKNRPADAHVVID